MNKNAIAMAADSAVTIGDHTAIHNSVNKLFALSMFEPIGAIIYANAQFMQIPMEIIIKEYKTEIGRRSFPTLQEYVDDFIAFMESHAALFHFKANEEGFIYNICDDLLQGLVNGYTKRVRDLVGKLNRPLTNEEDDMLKKEALEETFLFIDAQTRVNDGFADYVRKNYIGKIETYIGNNVSWVMDKVKLAEKICSLFDSGFTRVGYVGMAIAGYGRTEIFPHMVHIKLSGILDGRLRYENLEKIEISERENAAIIPLAQTDVMHTFIRGYNDVILAEVVETTPDLLNYRMKSIPGEVLDVSQREIVKKALENVPNDVVQLIRRASNELFVKPIIDSVTSLPIEELAMFAESMINITSVRRRVAIDGNIGTVGGPIDVAIVTRGDGLIWLKRKHYFEAKKNPQYLYSRYGHSGVKVADDEE